MVGGQLLEGRVHLYSFWAVIILAGVGFSVTQLSEDDTPIRNPSELTGSPIQTRWDHYQGLSLVWHLQWVDIHSFSLQGRAPTEISVMKGQEAGLSSLGHIKLWATWKQPLHSSPRKVLEHFGGHQGQAIVSVARNRRHIPQEVWGVGRLGRSGFC